MKPNELWEEFIVLRSHELRPPPHNFITLCGLCGNDGIIETKTAEHRDELVGIVGYCICPNGRARKARFAPNKLGSVVTTKADGGAYPWEEKEET